MLHFFSCSMVFEPMEIFYLGENQEDRLVFPSLPSLLFDGKLEGKATKVTEFGYCLSSGHLKLNRLFAFSRA